MRDLELFRMKKMQAYIAVRGSGNASENADVPSDRMALYSRITRPVLNYRVSKTRWCVLRWPTPSMAQAAGMSTEAFEDLYFDVCTLDYRKMARAMVPLERPHEEGRPGPHQRPRHRPHLQHQRHRRQDVQRRPQHPRWRSVLLPGERLDQRPHPVQHADALLGHEVRERLPGVQGRQDRQGHRRTTRKRLNEILDTDPGARYMGEFSLGFNPYILNPMCDILFDEKIAGSLHFTPGQAYEECDNGNRSAVHWDMVLIQRPEWGGGEIWFDGELIRKNGMFVPKDLKPLNPANLK